MLEYLLHHSMAMLLYLLEAHGESSSLHTPPPLTYAGVKCEHTTRSSFIHVSAAEHTARVRTCDKVHILWRLCCLFGGAGF
jgi:hypothetical protein